MLHNSKPHETKLAINSQEVNTKVILGYINTLSSLDNYVGKRLGYLSVFNLNQTEQFLWLDENCHSQIAVQIQHLQLSTSDYMYVICRVNEEFMVTEWRLFKSPLLLWQLQDIFNASYDILDFQHLMEIGCHLQSPYFYQFFWKCFSDLDFSKKFVSIPASKSHHHAYPGGLLKHSIECAIMVQSNMNMIKNISQNEKEATLLSALLHDVGKVKTLNETDHSKLGKIIDHEKFTLSVLSCPLQYLEGVWEQGAVVLQYLLTWTEKQGFCKFVGGNLFKFADHISVSTDLRNKAFLSKPNHYVYTAIQAGERKQFINRLN